MSGEHTRAVHTPAHPVPAQTPIGLPIYRSAIFRFADAQEYADVLARRRPGYSYAREANPTCDAFAQGVAALEGAAHGVPFSSGQAATVAAVLTACKAGDHVVAPHEAYGGTYGFLNGMARGLGIDTTFVDPHDLEAVAAAIRPETRLVWGETLANPTMGVTDLPAMAAIAHDAGALFVVDSTFASPVVCRPAEHGADVVMHSATKYISGHSDVIAGVLVADDVDLAERLRLTSVVLGQTLGPDDAWIAHRGLATLPLRVERHCRSAAQVAAALEGHPRLSRVDHPSLTSSRDHDLASKLFRDGLFGGVVTVHVTGGRAAGQAFCDGLRIITNATSLGGAHSVVSHVASTTHRQLDAAALAAARLDEGSVRISIGLEDADDIIADCLQSLDALPSP
ncbi:MAG TPA: aminotransferase class I/II-fold pyridoxal phosphate-dependent enzyme [Mycobacteriales bacterium]|nr:aminotransferase class I/II-fold pyridoxal phosphate-dependent enzyme [Mycobacteriales bacterium]